MIHARTGQISKKEKTKIEHILAELSDIYGDFYITRENLRLYIKENTDLFFNCIKKGDRIFYNEGDGIILVTGFSDKAHRIYTKVLAKNEESADKLVKVMLWNINCTLYAKIKKNCPLKNVLQNNGFKFLGNRNKEILLVKKSYPKTIEGESKC